MLALLGRDGRRGMIQRPLANRENDALAEDVGQRLVTDHGLAIDLLPEDRIHLLEVEMDSGACARRVPACQDDLFALPPPA